jgi:hypothetical protein
VFDLDGLEPGPFDDDTLPLGARVSREGLFAGLADHLIGTLAGSDGTLTTLSHTAGDNVPADLDAFYAMTASTANGAHATEVHGGRQSIADALTDSGDDVDALRLSVQRYLPSPTAPIVASFDPPPDAGVIHSGRGLDDVGPPASSTVDQPT